MKKLMIVISIMLGVSPYVLYAQNKTLKGKVIDDNLNALPYVSIAFNDTVEVGRTDLNGLFQISIPISVKKISFNTVGLEPVSIEFVDKCDEIEVVMMLSSTYDFMTLKKADRLRKKRFKKLPDLHKEAFAKGIFKMIKVVIHKSLFISQENKNDIESKFSRYP